MTTPEIWPGRSYPLGATLLEGGINFSLFSQAADAVELCLIDEQGVEHRLELPRQTAFCWHGFVPEVGAGQRYGFRVHGPYRPDQGLYCDPRNLLLDPYARAVMGDASNGFVSVVADDSFEWGDDTPPRTRWDQAVVYEMHVKGFTKQMSTVPPELRGTYSGLASDPVLEHLEKLGVTAVELMPVHQFVHDAQLLARGLRNYWGYMPIGFFAPHNEYSASGAAGRQVNEFKAMVKALHSAGLEVILDVVYNHTAEAGPSGPTFSFRGIDNLSYYRTDPANPGRYVDYTGVGNTLNMRQPNVLQLVMDSLRYWVRDMHVDGFRFDLAPALARGLHDVDRLSAFFEVIQQDPVISQVKLIAEPWDVGDGGYQVGNFPVLWSEWNGKYRDSVRDYWRSEPVPARELAWRVQGSPDLYSSDGRQPYNSVNFVTCHDGFTLEDLVSYNTKHNEANGEDNRDGDNTNRSSNCGVEGRTDDPQVIALRRRQKRNFLATLILSQGVPMLLSGDEIGRTQRGNNNAYCQDNEISWLDWHSVDQDLLRFVSRLIALRRDHTALRRSSWSRSAGSSSAADGMTWLKPDGSRLDLAGSRAASALAVLIDGSVIGAVDFRAMDIPDDDFLLLLNASPTDVLFQIPPATGDPWLVMVDTSCRDDETGHSVTDQYNVESRSLVCLWSPRVVAVKQEGSTPRPGSV